MDYFYFLQKNKNLIKESNNVPFKIIDKKQEIESWQSKKYKELIKSNLPSEWAQIGIVLDDPYLIIIRDLVEFPDGTRRGYLRLINRAYLQGNQGVAILPRLNNNFILLHQFRHATRSWNFEIPRGFGEIGLTSEQNARKEIDEEIGAEIIKIQDLGLYHNNTGLEAGEIKLFLADIKSVNYLEINEGISDIKSVTLEELEGMIASNIITDGFTIAAWSRAKLKKLI